MKGKKPFRLKFHPCENGWEIREMFGIFTYRLRGKILFTKGMSGKEGAWHVTFDTGEVWYADLLDIFVLFDLCETYLRGS